MRMNGSIPMPTEKAWLNPVGHTNKNKTKGHKTGRDLLKGEGERGEEKVCVPMCMWG